MDQTTETRIANLAQMKKVQRSHRQRLRGSRHKDFTRSLLEVQFRLVLRIRLKKADSRTKSGVERTLCHTGLASPHRQLRAEAHG